jgi:hypothetical protein
MLTQAPCAKAGIWLKLAGRADEKGAVGLLPTGIDLAARLWIDLEHAGVQSLGQRLQEAETHTQFLLYTVGQDHLRVFYRPTPLLAALLHHYLLELGLFVC